MKSTIGKIALLIIISMLIGVVAGCDQATPVATAAVTTAGSIATTAAPTTASNINPPGQLPVVKEKVTLRVVVQSEPNVVSWKYGENKLTTFLQDQTNIVFDFMMFPAAEAKTKLNLELSTGGDLGDVCMIQMDRAQLSTFGAQGMLTPLNDYIDKYSFHLAEAFDMFPAGEAQISAPDGNIYAYPKVSQTGLMPNTIAQRFWIHQGFLDKYGKGMPTTTEEMYQFMKWAKTSDPNGNGKADEVGWTGNEKGWFTKPTNFLMAAFTLSDVNGYYQKDDVIHYAKIENGWRNGLKYLAKLMKEGLMDVNYLSNNVTTLNTLVSSNNGETVATIAAGGVGQFTPVVATRLKYTPVPPIKGPDGFVNAFFAYYDQGMAPGLYTIPAKSTQKDVVAAFIDATYSDDFAWVARYGEKGIDWEVPAAGTIAVDNGPAKYRDINHTWGKPGNATWQGGMPAQWLRYGSQTGLPFAPVDKDGKPTYDAEKILYDYTRVMEKYVIPCAVPPFFFDTSTSIKAGELNSTLTKLADASDAEFIFGTKDINSDAEWFNYVAMMKAAGIDEYLKIQQTEYDRAWKGTMPKTYEIAPQRTK